MGNKHGTRMGGILDDGMHVVVSLSGKLNYQLMQQLHLWNYDAPESSKSGMIWMGCIPYSRSEVFVMLLWQLWWMYDE